MTNRELHFNKNIVRLNNITNGILGLSPRGIRRRTVKIIRTIPRLPARAMKIVMRRRRSSHRKPVREISEFVRNPESVGSSEIRRVGPDGVREIVLLFFFFNIYY